MFTTSLKKTILDKLRIIDWRLKKGFSLLEVLVAITVITVGLVGIVGLIVYNISISRVSSNKVIAVNLAQEGIEAVKNIRDSNWLAKKDWYEGIKGTVAGKNYILELSDPNQNPSTAEWEFSDGGVDTIDHQKYQVYYDKNEKFYAQEHGARPGDWEETQSDIHRLIKITKVDIDAMNYYLEVKSNVQWIDQNGNSHTITLEDHLYEYEVSNPQNLYHWELASLFIESKGGCEKAFCDTGILFECSVVAPPGEELDGKRAFGGDPGCVYDWSIINDYSIFFKVRDEI
ncbi:prepilin-type N-terminal cleavage/methylation domain-containing protein [Candidatus Parcubacteria bacterium]|nr:prepilin-type N-terminal cleavage/methylation domain-containing protein [Candidatus Parcubacteria bacterium]